MLLEIKNLTSGYNDNQVLHDISINVGHGEIVCLIGPNGAGKSTVLKSIVGLTNIKNGTIGFKDENITKLPTHALLKLGMGFVPQGRLVFPSLTVRENLEMGGYLVKRIENREERIGLVFSYFPVLKKKVGTKAGVLSGGEQQMLAIGRALMMTPELLMLDEPSLGLAPKITQEVYEKLKEINAAGTALLIVEQNVRQVLKYAQRGYLLAASSVKFSGTAQELGDEKLMHEAYLL